MTKLQDFVTCVQGNSESINDEVLKQTVNAIIARAQESMNSIGVMKTKLDKYRSKRQPTPRVQLEIQRIEKELDDKKLTDVIATLREEYDNALRPLSAAPTEAGGSPRDESID